MNTSIRCDGVTRRNFVRVGGLTALGLGMGNFLQLQRAAAANPPAHALLRTRGGQAERTRKARGLGLSWHQGGGGVGMTAHEVQYCGSVAYGGS